MTNGSCVSLILAEVFGLASLPVVLEAPPHWGWMQTLCIRRQAGLVLGQFLFFFFLKVIFKAAQVSVVFSIIVSFCHPGISLAGLCINRIGGNGILTQSIRAYELCLDVSFDGVFFLIRWWLTCLKIYEGVFIRHVCSSFSVYTLNSLLFPEIFFWHFLSLNICPLHYTSNVSRSVFFLFYSRTGGRHLLED